MRCQNCGREMKNGARFCIGCGAQHDANGQLVGGSSPKVDYNKTMMASNMQVNNFGGNTDYNKTMMTGSTGFKQYQPQQPKQTQNNYQTNNYANSGANISKKTNKVKSKTSPILVICPIIILCAIAFSLFGGKGKKNNTVVNQTTTIAESNVSNTNSIHLDGYWSADADYFYVDGEMMKNMWVGDYYVGTDGKKVISSWIDNKRYVNELGKMARNEWIEFTFYGEDGSKKNGYYYVGEDGLRVTNKTIDGRFLNDEGCYFPLNDESFQEEIKKKSKVNSQDLLNETSISAETTVSLTTVPATTVPATTVPPTTVSPTTVSSTLAPPETQIIVPTVLNVDAVGSDGNSISYQKTTENLPNEKIAKYESVFVDDINYPNLINGVNEWNTNRSRKGITQGETILNDNITVTYIVDVLRNDSKVFSICETITKLDNNKAFSIVKNGITFDSKTGQQLTLQDMCNGDDKYNDLLKKLIPKINSNKKKFDTDIYDEILSVDPEELLDYCTWYMSDTGIVFVFDSVSIGSENVNGFTVTLPYSDSCNKLLLTKYRK